MKQAQELAAPLFDTFRRISERPRKIEGLKTEMVTSYNVKYGTTKSGF